MYSVAKHVYMDDGKVDSSLFAYIVNLFGCFESKYQKFFPTPIIVKPYRKYIGITFLIYSTHLQNQILLEKNIYLLLTLGGVPAIAPITFMVPIRNLSRKGLLLVICYLLQCHQVVHEVQELLVYILTW